MKMDPMPAKPTNKDLGDRLIQVHDCVERHQKANLEHFRKLTKEVGELRSGFGLEPGQRPAAGTSTPWQAWRRTVLATTTSITAVAVVYKVGLAIGPGLWVALKSLMHAAAHGLI